MDSKKYKSNQLPQLKFKEVYMLKRFSILAITLLFTFTVVQAQLNQTGMITGVVNSPDGTPMPGVTVIAKSPAMVLPEMTTVSSENGRYRFPSLAPGTYELTFQLEGMNTIVRKGIKVNVGVTSSVDIMMELQTIQESIVVEGKSPTVDRQNTTKAANLDQEFLKSIPAVRDLGTYFNMTPGVTADTAHGGTVRDNSYNLDGVNLGDPAVGTEGVFFGMDIMEEISVQSGGLSAEYGAVRGAVVNVVSKSGGNKFSGTASIYYRNEDFQSTNTKGTPLEGNLSGFKYEIEPGITLGGPLAKDKLWFFFNASYTKSENYVPGYPYDGEDIPPDDYRPYPYVKFTFQPNQANKFIFSYNYSDIERNHRTASRFDTVDTTWIQETPTHVFNAHWTRNFGNNFFANFKVGYVDSTFNLLAKNTNYRATEYTTNRDAGGYGYDDLNGRDRLQINADGTVFVDDLAGAHEIKFGGEYTYSKNYWGRQYYTDPRNGCWQVISYGGVPWYGWVYLDMDRYEDMQNWSLFVQDTWSISNNLTLNLGLRYENQKGIIPVQAEDSVDINFFGYTINPSVTEKRTAMTWSTLAPRVGLIYDITSDGKTLLKASYSRYYAANITQWFTYLNPNDFTIAGVDLYSDGSIYGPWYWYLPGGATAGYGDKDLANPYVDEFVVGFERELWEDWSVGLRYIKKWDRDLIEDADGTALDMDALMNDGELIWTNYQPVTITDPYDGSPQTFWNLINPQPSQLYTVNPPGAERDYDGIEFTLNKRYSKGWQLMLSYVWQNSRGLVATDFNDSYGATGYYDNPNNHTNAYGRFPYERRHQFKVNGLVKGPWGINLSGYFRWLSGRRYTRTISSGDLGVALNQDPETIFAEERGSRGLPDIVQLDLRLEKVFKIGPVNLRVFADLFNVFNANPASAVETLSSTPTTRTFEEMTDILDPRMLRLGAKIEF